jgi:hypothetical protein
MFGVRAWNLYPREQRIVNEARVHLRAVLGRLTAETLFNFVLTDEGEFSESEPTGFISSSDAGCDTGSPYTAISRGIRLITEVPDHRALDFKTLPV